MSAKTRNNAVDILKGIGIIMMTLGHCHAPFRYTFYYFHVAIFFIASGFFFKNSYAGSFSTVSGYVIKRIRGLWLPYFLWIAILTLTHNLQLGVGILTSDTRVFEYAGSVYDYEMIASPWNIGQMLNSILRAFFFGGGVSFAGNTWFLRVLFMTALMYCAGEFLIGLLTRVGKSKTPDADAKPDHRIPVIQSVVSAIFAVIGFLLQKKGILLYGISTMFSCYMLFHAGTIIGWLTRKHEMTSITKPVIAAGTASTALIAVFCIFKLGYNSIALSTNTYPDPIFLFVASVAGWFSVYMFSKLFEKVPPLKAFLSACGRHSLIIMLMHPICFKVVNFIQVWRYNLPHYALASYPVIYSDGLWWLLCAVVGVMIPLLIGMSWSELKSVISKKE